MSVKVIAYRGEHGKRVEGNSFQSRLGSLSFGTLNAANIYATSPNNPDDTMIDPRIYKVELTISNPVINDPNEPFMDASRLVETLGKEKAIAILRELKEHLYATDNWFRMEEELNLENSDDAFEEMAEKHLDYLLKEAYLNCYPIFDEKKYVSWFQEAGFDGLVHAGNGATAQEPEYKVFSREQITLIQDISLSNKITKNVEMSL